MLTRIETAYLAILRIVVLIVATLALLTAVVAAALSLPALARQFGMIASEKPQGGTLTQYIDARRATIPAKPGTSQPASTPSDGPHDANAKAAAGIFQSYTKGATGMTIPLWTTVVEQSGRNVAPDDLPAYFSDVRSLAEQLQKSTGKRLDVNGVRDLLAWNANQYRDDAGTKGAEKARATQAALAKMYVASAAFFLFIIVIFTFLFVKVERSLRLVRTVQVGELVDA